VWFPHPAAAVSADSSSGNSGREDHPAPSNGNMLLIRDIITASPPYTRPNAPI
jgi:hypothetical protein